MGIVILIAIIIVAIVIIGSLGGILNFMAEVFGWLFKSAISFVLGSILILFIIGNCIGACHNSLSPTTTTTTTYK